MEKAPPLPIIPQNLKEEGADLPGRPIIKRPGFGTSGRRVSLLANHFKVSIRNPNEFFYQYSVSISFEDNMAVDSKVVGRKVIDNLYQTYSSELAGKRFAYDGEKSLYTVGALPQNKFEFTVILEESTSKSSGSSSNNGSSSEFSKRSKHSLQSKIFKVEISYAAKIPLKSLSLALQGAEIEYDQDALRVLDIILRQQAAKRGCLLVRQSFFHDDSRMFTDVGGGVTGVRGLHSSFRPTLDGLSLNMDVSTTMILKPGPVVDFLLANQNVKDPRYIDWAKIKAIHSNKEFKIIGLSEKPCNQQFFSLKVKSGSASAGDSDQALEITVYDYFVKHRNIELKSSSYMPCLDVGKPRRPNYLPLEAVSNYKYDEDPLLVSCGISIEKQLTRIDGRVLDAPKLKFGNNEDFLPRNGRWNFNNKKLLKPKHIEEWALVNFSAGCDCSHLSRELINCGRNKGIEIERPYTIVEEDPQCRRASPVVRVEKMFEHIMAKLPGPPEFLLCVLPERKNCDIYGPWKKKCLSSMGIVTQCISPIKINDQYLTNVLLKINSKLGGTNSLLAIEHSNRIPLITDQPTMILGMDVSHGSPGRSDVPSIAAVVGSRSWPLISRYRAAVRTQSAKVEMIESLFKPLANGQDDGIMRELFVDFFQTSNGRKPTQIVVFRDGVSESQFAQVINIELDQMIKAYQHLGESDIPKFTLIVAQKNHHTKLFQASAPENVPCGTVVDTKIVHPRNYDFYMCSQAGLIGTSRPAHYHVLLDEIGFSPDELQNLIHSLSYVYQRSTNAISIVAPVCYAHLAAQQMGQFMKFEDFSETSSGQNSMTTTGSIPVPELPRLHKDVAGSMFFC
ncbi:Argonaute family protein [Perilla frutescens var. frutescens]|nr:Argonaute family protein [Perilla frutescens var. frutescens]